MGFERDRHIARAREDAEGTQILANPYGEEAIALAREEAEGVELFENPDADIPVSMLKEGEPGRESLVGEVFEDREEWRGTE